MSLDEMLSSLGKAKKRARVLRAVGIDETDWRAKLVRKKNGDILKCLANVTTVLSFDERWAGVLAYDGFGECVASLKEPPTRPQDRPERARPGEWSDEDTSRAAAWLTSEHGLDVGPGVVDQAVAVVARRKEVHPVRDYLASLVWDGKARLDAMLVTHFGAEDTPYARGVSCRWMISAVARVSRPGCQSDCALVLESREQGVGKSTGLKALMPDSSWFSDTGVTIGDKDSYQSLRRKWLYEWSELSSVRGKELEKIKQFISAASDNYRPSYGHRNRDFPRQVFFGGTTNESEYLVDRTGNRRFLPVKARKVDREAIARDRDQLWAEARTRFESGEAWHVNTPEFAELCRIEQDHRIQSDVWQEVIHEYTSNPVRNLTYASTGYSTKDILTEALKIDIAKATRGDEMRVGGLLRVLGFERKTVGTKRLIRWFRADSQRDTTHQVSRQVSHQNSEHNQSVEIPEIPEIPMPIHTREGSTVNRGRQETVSQVSQVSLSGDPWDELFADYVDRELR